MRNVSTIMITGLGFGLEDTGLGLGLEPWPWPRRLLALALALASNMLSSNPSLGEANGNTSIQIFI